MKQYSETGCKAVVNIGSPAGLVFDLLFFLQAARLCLSGYVGLNKSCSSFFFLFCKLCLVIKEDAVLIWQNSWLKIAVGASNKTFVNSFKGAGD